MTSREQKSAHPATHPNSSRQRTRAGAPVLSHAQREGCAHTRACRSAGLRGTVAHRRRDCGRAHRKARVKSRLTLLQRFPGGRSRSRRTQRFSACACPLARRALWLAAAAALIYIWDGEVGRGSRLTFSAWLGAARPRRGRGRAAGVPRGGGFTPPALRVPRKRERGKWRDAVPLCSVCSSLLRP